jgi:hypothetical protein
MSNHIKNTHRLNKYRDIFENEGVSSLRVALCLYLPVSSTLLVVSISLSIIAFFLFIRLLYNSAS